MTAERVEMIEQCLREAFSPDELSVVDESHKHVGHPGARDGRGHFHVRIVSVQFTGLPRLARHRRVYRAMGELMTTDIHALSIEALSKNEAPQ